MNTTRYNGLRGLSGHASAMISSLRNNCRKRKVALLRAYTKKSHYNNIVFEHKTTQKQLDAIRNKIRSENKTRLVKYIILFVLFFTILIYFAGFYKY